MQALDRFKSDANGVMIASDVAARGLDIRDVRLVVHYQLPASLDTYVHRCGRTARGAGAEGVAVALVAAEDASKWRALCGAIAQQQQQQQQQNGGGNKAPAVIPTFPIDATLMPKASEARVRQASR